MQEALSHPRHLAAGTSSSKPETRDSKPDIFKIMDTPRIGAKDSVLVLPRVGGKALNLKAGDVVRAQVIKVLSGGELSLRLGGAVVQARSVAPLPPGTGILFRVLGQESGQGGDSELRLQFLQVADTPAETAQTGRTAPMEGGGGQVTHSAADPRVEVVRNLARQLAGSSPVRSRDGAELAETIRGLLKSLPEDPASLPRDLRHQLLGLLQSNLRETEQSIQARALQLFSEAPIRDLLDLPDQPEMGQLLKARMPLFAEAEKILHIPLKSLLQDTGVALEAKLKVLAQALLAEEDARAETAVTAGLPQTPSAETAPLERDLKARLLQLRQLILEGESMSPETTEGSRGTAGMTAGETRGGLDKLFPVVDGLLRDIETFQLLSKLTSSFYTFLPFLWKGLREGDIAFKRSRGSQAGQGHYCVMNLDFESLGRVTIVAMMQGGDFFLSFKTDHEGLRSALDGGIQELRGMFRSEGLNLREVNIFDGDDPRLAPFEHLESFESVLNLKI